MCLQDKPKGKKGIKEMEFVKLETRRDGYSVSQVGSTLTVKELIERLSEFDEDLPVVFSNDNGYTYGAIKYYSQIEKGEDEE